MDNPQPRTEQITFNALKLQKKEALAAIQRLAELHELQVNTIEERPNRLSVDLSVSVTGDNDNIAAFAKAAGGTRDQDQPMRALRRWIGAIIDGVPTYLP
jgi:hypothetical protein